MNPNVFTTTSPMGGGGSTAQVTPGELTKFLVEQSQAEGVQVRLQTKAVGLVMDDNKVKGVQVESNGKEETLPATDVVLATGYVAARRTNAAPGPARCSTSGSRPKPSRPSCARRP